MSASAPDAVHARGCTGEAPPSLVLDSHGFCPDCRRLVAGITAHLARYGDRMAGDEYEDLSALGREGP
jgi:hypothetical protein